MKKLEMKKLVILLLSLAMVFALGACANTDTTASQDDSDLAYVRKNG